MDSYTYSKKDLDTLKQVITTQHDVIDNIEEIIPRLNFLCSELAKLHSFNEIFGISSVTSDIIFDLLKYFDPTEKEVLAESQLLDFNKIQQELNLKDLFQKAYDEIDNYEDVEDFLLDSIQNHAILVSIAAKRAWRSIIRLVIEKKNIHPQVVNFFHHFAYFYSKFSTELMVFLELKYEEYTDDEEDETKEIISKESLLTLSNISNDDQVH